MFVLGWWVVSVLSIRILQEESIASYPWLNQKKRLETADNNRTDGNNVEKTQEKYLNWNKVVMFLLLGISIHWLIYLNKNI